MPSRFALLCVAVCLSGSSAFPSSSNRNPQVLTAPGAAAQTSLTLTQTGSAFAAARCDTLGQGRFAAAMCQDSALRDFNGTAANLAAARRDLNRVPVLLAAASQVPARTGPLAAADRPVANRPAALVGQNAALATLFSPTPGSVLAGSSVTFAWVPVGGASAYWLDVGTVQGQGNIFGQNVGTATSQTVSGIPVTGITIYVRLWTLFSGIWQYNDYTYTAANTATKAAIFLPPPGSTFGGTSVTFTWTGGAGASAYWLDVGTVLGQGNVFGKNVGTATSQTVSGIPANGAPVYVRLWSLLSGVWLFNDYTFTASGNGNSSALTSPAPGSMLGGNLTTFVWNSAAGSSGYWLEVNNVCPGCGGIFNQNEGLATSQVVAGLPTDGSTVYVRLWTLQGGNWLYNDYTYAAFNGSGGGTKAAITSPAPNSTLSGGSATFTWNAAAGASAYWLDVGTVQGQGNIFGQNVGAATSQTVTNIPASGTPIFVRLWTLIGGVWLYNDYTYTTSGFGAKATLSSPAPGATFSGSSVAFVWTAGSAASAYWLDVGQVPGQGTYFGQNVGLATSQSVNNLPLDGSTIYVRLWTLLGGVWQYNDYTYTAASSGTKAALTVPTPGSTLNSSVVTFIWSSGLGAAAYWLDVGTAPGQGNIFGQNLGLATNQTVFGIPTNGSTIYVRLWTLLGGAWQYTDYTFLALH